MNSLTKNRLTSIRIFSILIFVMLFLIPLGASALTRCCLPPKVKECGK